MKKSKFGTIDSRTRFIQHWVEGSNVYRAKENSELDMLKKNRGQNDLNWNRRFISKDTDASDKLFHDYGLKHNLFELILWDCMWQL